MSGTSLDMVVVGKFGRSVGLKGGVRVNVLTDFPETLVCDSVFYIDYTDNLASFVYNADNIKAVVVGYNDKSDISMIQNTFDFTTLTDNLINTDDTKIYLPLTLKYFHPIKKIAEFKEITSRQKAELLCNMFFYSTIDDTRKLCSLNKDEFFYFDIIGMCVVEEGLKIGVIKDIQEIANTHYLVLDKHFLIPYIDRYVLSVDLENRKIFTRDARFLRMD